ncbi:MAG: response regulator [Bacteroidetes bacterium]|nr:response regulator [Bacteroidota bacterium]
MENKFTLLYVDDEVLNLTLFEHNFKKDYTILTAESGDEGLKILKDNSKISAVISDMKMPGMNGVEFIRTAKNMFPEISYFILTGFDITEEIADALNDKVIEKYFRKPFSKVEIKSALKEVLEKE